MNTLDQKKNRLKEIIRAQQKVVVAFSGGVDSSLLLAFSHKVLESNTLSAITIESAFHHPIDQHDALSLIENLSIPHYQLSIDPLSHPSIANNHRLRCYHCKSQLFKAMKEFADSHDLGRLIEGTHIDDLNQYRPGLQAINELNILSPLVEAKFNKADIRALALELGLKTTSSKPSSACLATRIPYDQPITLFRLERIANAELYLRNLGFNQLRVRDHLDLARIEVMPKEFEKLLKERKLIIDYLQKLGWQHITLDLAGFRSGSFDFVIKDTKQQENERS